jgi:hypothetical protein
VRCVFGDQHPLNKDRQLGGGYKKGTCCSLTTQAVGTCR